MTLKNKSLGLALLLSLLLAVEGTAAGKGTGERAEDLMKAVEEALGGGKVWTAFVDCTCVSDRDRDVRSGDRSAELAGVHMKAEVKGRTSFDHKYMSDRDRGVRNSDSSTWKKIARAELDIVVDKPEAIWSKTEEVFEKAGIFSKSCSGPFSIVQPRLAVSLDIGWFHVRPVSSEEVSRLRSELSNLIAKVTRYTKDVSLYTAEWGAQNRDTVKEKIAKEIASCGEGQTEANLLFVFKTQVKGIQRVLECPLSTEGDGGTASEDIQFEDYYRVKSDVGNDSKKSENILRILKNLLEESQERETKLDDSSMRWNPATGELTFIRKKEKIKKEGGSATTTPPKKLRDLLEMFVTQTF